MPPIPPQAVQINCPNCGNAYQANLFTIVDVSQQPELKQRLLSGQLNTATCPQCNTTVMLAAPLPLIYHDAEKQLCLVHVPQEMNLNDQQQEQLIGDSTRALMQNLPPDAPRAHLLTPHRFMSLASLIDTILEADGIPREVLERQRRHVELISQFASALADEQQFAQLVEQNKSDLDATFFQTIGAYIKASEQEGQQESAQVLTMLHDKLASMVGFAGDGEQQQDASNANTEVILDSLSAVSDDELEQLVAEVRPSLDYGFFQAWTARIEDLQQKGDTAEAQRLTERRSRILELIERMDQEAQAMFEAGTNLLREALNAENPDEVLRAHSEEINEAFMLVLSANIESAQRAGQQDLAERMQEISRLAMEIVQEKLPPDERFINQLMLTEAPEEIGSLLRSNTALITVDFVKKLNEMADEQGNQGNKASAEKLRRLAREAGAMLY